MGLGVHGESLPTPGPARRHNLASSSRSRTSRRLRTRQRNLPNRGVSPDRVQYSTTDSDSSPDVSHQRLQSSDDDVHDFTLAGHARGGGDSRHWHHQSDEEVGEELYTSFHQQNLFADYRSQSNNSLHFDLTSLAERFSRSAARDQVRQRAEELDLSTLTTQNFNSLLSELFHDGGVTQERLLVLFFFCSDLTIRACRAGLASLCQRITGWTLDFIRGTVLVWVRIQGGWSRVLSGRNRSGDKWIVVGTAIALLSAAYVLVKRAR